MSSTSAVFIGDGSLLVQCATAWRAAGHRIDCIASHDSAIVEWAASNGVAAVRVDADSEIALLPGEFDFLFSIANLHVLPPGLIKRAGKLAINFHDGPLPRYAGLNAPAWALIAGEKTHGITWHEMTDSVDAGRIVRQVTFAVPEEGTALALNARCYEAGLAAFTSMAQDIAIGELAPVAQVGPRSYFRRNQKPEALATLDFTRPAAELAALVRALDFGSYANPLAKPKIWLGDDILLV
ncbi:MAG TPA: formyltransferase family protein, partial [Ramlibacter sp.]|nr:formyltransferase family protein [Ramlibacter sp.]